jgi:glycosyltransferase involved in cell wall biosynthesis
MLVFIIPLKSPQVSKSWENVSFLFEKTLKSICNQTSSNFKVIVVCNAKPDISYSYPNVIYLVDSFPIPGVERGYTKERDRTKKMLRGILYAKKLKDTTHIMLVDADDRVSERLAEYVSLYSNCPGWFITNGYCYQENSSFIKVMRKAFHHYCGTSNILRKDLYDVNSDDKETCDRLFNAYRHKQLEKTLEAKGVLLESLPFKGAVYIINNGENTYYGIEKKNHKVSLKSRLLRWKSLLDNRFLTPTIKKEFSLLEEL